MNKIYYPGMEFDTPSSVDDLPIDKHSSNDLSKQLGDTGMPVIRIENFNAFQDIVTREDNVLVKFEAEWCMPCKAMASVVEEIANQHPHVKVLAVDIEAEGMDDILIKYGVRSLPTFVHIKEGTRVNSACGTITKAELTLLISGE